MWLMSCDIEGSFVSKNYSIPFGLVSFKFICGKFYSVTLMAIINERFPISNKASTKLGVNMKSTSVCINASHSMYIGIILL